MGRMGRALALAGVMGAVAFAGEDDAPPARLGEVVVTGSKVETQQWDSTVPVQVVPRSRIAETATVDIENVLDEIPGLYVRRNEQFGLGASTVRMQGGDPNKVAILVDGRRFRGGIDGVVDLRDIPANNIERVEVIRGPASSLYGSDAMSGVINIITRTGTPDPHVEATGAGGSFGRRFGAVSHSWSYGPVRWFLSGVHDEVRLFEQFGAISRQFSGANEDEKQNRDQGSLRVDADLGPKHAITLSPSYQQQSNPTSTNENLATAAEWRWRTSENSNLTTWVNRYGFHRENGLTGFEEESDFVDWEGESRWTTALGGTPVWETNFVTAGTRARRQALDRSGVFISGPRGKIFDPPVNESVWQVSPFLQTDVLFDERWSLLLGTSVDVHERYGVDPNPRATLTYRPWEPLRLSATVGRGFRAPDLTQLFTIDINQNGAYALLGNPDLDPETDVAVNLEAAVRWRGVDGFLTLFRHDFRDLIVFPQAVICRQPGVPPGCLVDPLPNLPGSLRFQAQNLSRATSQGLELAVDLSPLEWLDVPPAYRATIGIGYALTDSENRNGIAGQDGKVLPFRPRHRVLPSAGWKHPGLGIGVRVWGEFESETFSDVANSPDLSARAHWTFGFKVAVMPLRWLPAPAAGRVAQAFALGRNVELFAQGDNVFDARYGTLTGAGRIASPAAFLFGVGARF